MKGTNNLWKSCFPKHLKAKGGNFGKMKYYQFLFSKNKQINKAHFLLKIRLLRKKKISKRLIFTMF